MALDKDDIKALIAILQKGLQDDPPSHTEEDTPVAPPKPRPKQRRTKVGAKQEESTHQNKFLSMGIANLHKDDTKIDKLLSKNSSRTPRTRKFSTMEVTCRSCGKRETINPVLLYDSPDRYKCNSCSTSAG
jgi:hypothetical protein